jgi:hypothetical protein
MHPTQDDSHLRLTTPPEGLDLAQSILVRWGETLPWCWSTWDDPRIVHVDIITYLVSQVIEEGRQILKA